MCIVGRLQPPPLQQVNEHTAQGELANVVVVEQQERLCCVVQEEEPDLLLLQPVLLSVDDAVAVVVVPDAAVVGVVGPSSWGRARGPDRDWEKRTLLRRKKCY